MESQIKYAFAKIDPKIRMCQGDILKDISIPIATDYDYDTKEYFFEIISLNYGVIISQDCDLDHDYTSRISSNASITQDKYLPNILILPAYLAQDLKNGKHRGELKCEEWDTKRWKQITHNNNARFHYINAYKNLQIPELVIDFKHAYTMSRDILYKQYTHLYLATIAELFREDLSGRYSYYLSRIGLPELNNTDIIA